MENKLSQKPGVVLKTINQDMATPNEESAMEVRQAIARGEAQAMAEVMRDHRDRPGPVRLSIKPEPFHGYQTEDAGRWMAKFGT